MSVHHGPTDPPIRVLGDRVLIRPDREPHAVEALPSGVLVAETMAAAIMGSDERASVTRGTVVAVGQSRHPLRDEAYTLAEKLSTRYDAELHPEAADAVALLQDLVRPTPSVAVGDDVIFSPDVGQTVTIDHETWMICREQDLLAVIES